MPLNKRKGTILVQVIIRLAFKHAIEGTKDHSCVTYEKPRVSAILHKLRIRHIDLFESGFRGMFDQSNKIFLANRISSESSTLMPT